MQRRQALNLFLKGGLPLGVLAGAGLYGRYTFLPPHPSARLDSVQNLAVRLHDSLDPEMRAAAMVDYDHPYRQYHNRGVSGGGLSIGGWDFTWKQRSLLTDLLHAGLSEAGRALLPAQFFINWPGVHLMKLLLCDDPRSTEYQIILTGPHLNLRLGGSNREGVAFGGPQVYGDQRGNNRQGLPGNVYRHQFELAHRLFTSLEPHQQQAALLRDSPIQTQIELQGRHGTFAGIPVAELSADCRLQAAALTGNILSTYANEDTGHARLCLEENGGVDGLHLSYYEEGEVGGSGAYQIFRLEGPAAVLYFRGYPHVHAFINVAMDGDRPLSVGEVVGANPEIREGEQVKSIFEQAMRRQTGTDLAHYPRESVVGRLRPGILRTGDIYTAESWQDRIMTTTIQGSRVGGEFLDDMMAAGAGPDTGRTYTLATTSYAVSEGATALLGRAGPFATGGMLRDAIIHHLRSGGLAAPEPPAISI